MAGRLLRRRAAAAAGSYVAIVARICRHGRRPRGCSRRRRSVSTRSSSPSTGFFQALLDLTIEEALIKYGFRYVAREDWGRLRRLFRRTFVFKLVGAVLAGLALLALWPPLRRPSSDTPELRLPLAIGAAIPLLQAPEGMAAGRRSCCAARYDVRGVVSRRVDGAAPDSRSRRSELRPCVDDWGDRGRAGCRIARDRHRRLAAHFAASRRAPRRALGEDAREIVRFVLQSSGATGAVSLRSTLTPIVLGVVSTTTQVAYFKVAQAPQQGFNAVSAPVRLVMLTEQTRDWEHGDRARVFAGVRRYSLLAALGSVALLPPLLIIHAGPRSPALHSRRTSARFPRRASSSWRARCSSWSAGRSRSPSPSAGRSGGSGRMASRPLVLLPLAVLLGWKWGAAGAAGAVLVSSVVFAIVWLVLYPAHPQRAGRSLAPAVAPEPMRSRLTEIAPVNVLVVSGIWPPDVGGPASHAPQVASFLLERGHGVAVVTTAQRPPAPAVVSRPLGLPLPAEGSRARQHGLEVARRARGADVVYTTGMFGRSAARRRRSHGVRT